MKLPCIKIKYVCYGFNILFWGLLACGDLKTGNVQAPEDGHKLRQIGYYKLPIDYNTGFDADFIYPFQLADSSQQYVALGYRNTRIINVYDYGSQSIVKKLKFPFEGPNGIGNELGGFVFDGLDSIYVYAYWGKEVVLFHNNQAVKRYKLPDDGNKDPLVELGNMCPLLKNDEKLYLSGLVNPFALDRKPVFEINTITDSISTVGYIPAKAFEGNYLYLNQIKYDYIPNQHQIILGFDIMDIIYIYNPDNKKIEQFYAKADNIGIIKPISNNPAFKPSKEEANAYEISDRYWGIKYDPYRKLYYRFAIAGRTLDELYKGMMPSFILCVFDENFNKIDELFLPYKSQIEMSFITTEGLHIANRS